MHKVETVITGLAAILFFITAAATEPHNPGMYRLKSEDYAGAQTYFQRALQKHPQNAEAAAGMAMVSLDRGQNKNAVQWAHKAITLAPKAADYRLLLAVALGQYVRDVDIFSKLGIAYKVRAALQKAVELDPDNAQARAALAKYYILAPGIVGGSLQKADEQINALERLDPEQSAAVRAIKAEQSGDLEKAEIYLRCATQLDKTGDADYRLGTFLLDQKRYVSAISAFEAGIVKNPANSLNYYGVGQAAALGNMRIREGIEDLEKYLSLPHDWLPGTPTYKQAHHWLRWIDSRADHRAGAQHISSRYRYGLRR